MPVWSTAELPGTAQFGFWRDVICEAFAALDPRTVAPNAAFPSQVALSGIGPVNAAHIASCAQIVHRGPRELRADPQDRLFVNLQVAGSGRMVQDDRVATLSPGSFALVDTARPYRLEFDGAFEMISFRVPRQHLLPLVDDPTQLFARRIDGTRGMGRLASGFMQLLMREADGLAPEQRGEVASHLCQLVASSVQRTSDPAAEDPRARFRSAALAHIESVLEDPQLSAATLARRFGVSVRYVQQAFADGGLTVVAYVRDARLDRCARALAHPRERRSIAAVAMANGFADVPHFNRAFRARYGCSPGDYRGRFRS